MTEAEVVFISSDANAAPCVSTQTASENVQSAVSVSAESGVGAATTSVSIFSMNDQDARSKKGP